MRSHDVGRKCREEEEHMRIDGWPRWFTGVAVLLALTGCAGATAGTAVAVTDIATVAGKWTGLLEMAGSQDREDFVELTVDGSGRYQAVAARTIGAMDTQGKVGVLGDGKVLFRGDRGSQATATLYTRASEPQRTLVMDGTTPSDRRFRARLHQRL
jgi:hypothetical protein